MELADGGDLFDKIEADEGVGEDIAHFYFAQLISAVSYMHSKGVAHRDLKPENVLLSKDGDLKLADFGLAALFTKDGKKRLCNTVCGSPPYIAPEIVSGRRTKRPDVLDTGYAANIADIWSCGVVLFVLLVGNTPWDEPTRNSWEFNEYIQTDGHTSDELWTKIPSDILSLLRGMLKLNPSERFTLDEIRTHPWFTRRNPYLTPSGKSANPVALATQMLESLHINFNSDISPSQRHSQQRSSDAMDLDDDVLAARFTMTQPETPTVETPFDWERPPPLASQPVGNVSASQPVHGYSHHGTQISGDLYNRLSEDPALSQFSQVPQVPMSLTQAARRFGDIVPSHTLARFVSQASFGLLLPLLGEALHRLHVPVPAFTQAALEGKEDTVWIKVKTIDGRQQGLNGKIAVERLGMELVQVSFERIKGDPLEWRRFFKNVVLLCKEAVLVPGSI
jgi:serine/threonine-protein kinase CHEK1